MAESNPGIISRLSKMQRGQTDKEAKPVEINQEQINETQDIKLHFEDMCEVPINLTQKLRVDSPTQMHGCDICMIESILTLSLYLCYVCGVYMCEKCLKRHNKTHEFVKAQNGERERIGKAEGLVLGMRGENKVKRAEELDGESTEVIGHVSVKHKLDKNDCYITGLCGLESKRWVAVDSGNFCIKIFCSVSNTLLRYIEFGTGPWGVTEIKVQQKTSDSDPTSGSRTDISGAARDEPDKHCLLAVTSPFIKQIWFIDVNATPALKSKTMKLDKECSAIDFSEDKIFTLCWEDVVFSFPFSIYILSTEGNQLKVIQNSDFSSLNIHHLAVHKGQVYLSDVDNEKVLCINVEDGKTISHVSIVEERSWPTGISVDRNTGVVYVCEWNNNKVYKLSPDLREYEPLSLDTDYTEWPFKLCFMNNKLFISHYDLQRPSIGNVVTVVHLLT